MVISIVTKADIYGCTKQKEDSQYFPASWAVQGRGKVGQRAPKGEFAREVLRQYVETDRRWKQIRKWGEESAKRLKIRGEREVEDIIEQYRKEQSV